MQGGGGNPPMSPRRLCSSELTLLHFVFKITEIEKKSKFPHKNFNAQIILSLCDITTILLFTQRGFQVLLVYVTTSFSLCFSY